MNDFVLIRKNLFRKKLRAGLMIVSIIVAFAIFGVLAAFERAFDAGEDVAHADRLVVVNKINFTQPLPVAYANRIRGIDGVANLTHANWFGGYFQDPKNFLIVFAVEPETYMDLYSDDLDFPAEARRAFVRDRSGAMVGETLARKRGWKVGDHVPISSQIFSQKNGARTWDFTDRRHLHQPHAARRHQFHDLPVRLFRRDPLLRQGHDRLDRAAHRLAVDERPGRQGRRQNVRQLLL